MWIAALPLALAPGSPGTEPVLETAHFEFHSSELVNLHHYLYEWARTTAGMRGSGVEELGALDGLSEEERETWTAAYGAYIPEWAGRDLLFDRQLDAANKALRRSLDVDRLDPEFPADLAEALAIALPIYREHWWARHDEVNRAWIAELAPVLEKVEEAFAARLAHAYGGEWQAEPLRVDVTYYGNWAGAYTTNRPNHVTITSRDPENGGHGALEVLFHEASHAEGLGSPILDGLNAAFRGLETRPHEDLWHAMFFYTAGELTRDLLLEHELAEDYRTYGERNMWKRLPGWAAMRDALDVTWRPFLSGEWDRAEAFARLADELSAVR